ncbi:O-acetylhomoserine aminocarboxypropyltransferase/cysteine synthase family protein [Herbiconiux daphne]|uniref:Aminotransferase class I/II-fold pyridoxal phosphate-dependent enzyme n=1 Tax=Herbiconiux daphne TaxID=2970914 RepID=A0ABT2H2L9_9MICO|nr:aminotransferase class I/II-fold pyridoxal phosphate-dependent enzyme [Herbiconiux daphne]MCS5734162.1 aminotransferase class I/II-fold pyridoxal phosphate-dependent enzyme [Herbiconiux daphne]
MTTDDSPTDAAADSRDSADSGDSRGARDFAASGEGRFSTRQIRSGFTTAAAQNPAVVPIYQTAAYEFESFSAARDIFSLRKKGNLYSRTGNPTQTVLEERIAALDGGVAALATGSGQSAVLIALLTLAKTGDHIVAARQLYGGTLDLLTDTFADFGIDVTLVDQHDLAAWRDAARPNTRAFFAETIGNPTASVLAVQDVADIAHRAGVPLIVDNTIATPYLQRPKEFGADIVVYSATKFLGGHGSSLAGVIVDLGTFDFGAEPARWPQFTEPFGRVGDVVLWKRFGREGSAFLVYAKVKLVHDLGPSLSPFNSFQIIQGIETLDLRVAKQTASALAVAAFLESHPAVALVRHPGLPDDPGYASAQRYLPRGAGSVFSFDLVVDDAHADAAGVERLIEGFVDSLRLFKLVANIGDARSLVIHPATTTHSHLGDSELALAGFSRATVRLSIGLEDVEDLIADLDRSLALVAGPSVALSRAN